MKRYKYQYLLFLILIIFIIFFSYIWIQNARSIYNQVESSMRKIDSSFSEMLHVHVDKKHTLSFYTTINNELVVVSLERKLIGFKLESYVTKTPLITEKEISWQGVSKPNEDIHLLFGTVQNQDTTQIIIVSEMNQSANIIRAESLSFWYLLTDESVHTPVTIQTFNKDGEKLYETGDVNYWNDKM